MKNGEDPDFGKWSWQDETETGRQRSASNFEGFIHFLRKQTQKNIVVHHDCRLSHSRFAFRSLFVPKSKYTLILFNINNKIFINKMTVLPPDEVGAPRQ